MPTYIGLVNWTEKGIQEVKDSPTRLDAVKGLMKGMGAEMTAFYMTMGAYDMVVVMEAPSDEVMAQAMLRINSGGHVRSTTLKAFPEADYRKLVAALG
ncbi:MAG: GYD domain-containing protein [Pseudomonadota bacterium]